MRRGNVRDDLFRAFSAWIFLGASILGRLPQAITFHAFSVNTPATCGWY